MNSSFPKQIVSPLSNIPHLLDPNQMLSGYPMKCQVQMTMATITPSFETAPP